MKMNTFQYIFIYTVAIAGIRGIASFVVEVVRPPEICNLLCLHNSFWESRTFHVPWCKPRSHNIDRSLTISTFVIVRAAQ